MSLQQKPPKPFKFKQFELYQHLCGMKITQDACFFGAWVSEQLRHHITSSANQPQKQKTIIKPDLNLLDIGDIGTGTGLLSLMCAQTLAETIHPNQSHFQDWKITAVDIDREAIKQANQNFKSSVFFRARAEFKDSENLQGLEADIKDLKTEGLFNYIVCNPPFFERSLKNPDVQKAKARHTDTLSFGELLIAIERQLKPDTLNNVPAQAWVLLPIKESKLLIDAWKQSKISAVRKNLSVTIAAKLAVNPQSMPHRAIISISKHSSTSITVETESKRKSELEPGLGLGPIRINFYEDLENRSWSSESKALMAPYYLNI